MRGAQACTVERLGKEELRNPADRANPLHAGISALAIAANDCDSCAGASETLRQSAAQRPGPADHHGDLSRQIE